MPSTPRRTQKRQTTDAADRRGAGDRVYERDFDKVRPEKVVPGVVGRSQWFTWRAGQHEQALTLERLRRGIREAQEQEDSGSLRAQVLEDAYTLLAGMTETMRNRSLGEPTLLDTAGRRRPSALGAASRRNGDGLTALSRHLDLESEGLLVLPVDENVAAELDLETVVLAELSHPLEPVLDATAVFSPQERVVVARIRRPGRYQVFALPKDPWLRATLDTLARYWKWVERDPSLREGEGKRTVRPEMVDRIGEIVLFAPAASADIGDRTRRLLGELEVVDGALVRPPLIKWWWDLFPRCSRWFSIGPVPDAGSGASGA
jgi:hypothetical protein